MRSENLLLIVISYTPFMQWSRLDEPSPSSALIKLVQVWRLQCHSSSSIHQAFSWVDECLAKQCDECLQYQTRAHQARIKPAQWVLDERSM